MPQLVILGVCVAFIFFWARRARLIVEEYVAGEHGEMAVADIPEEWRASIQQSEKALSALNFRLLVCTHNRRRTAKGVVNGSAVFTSADGNAALLHGFTRESGAATAEENFQGRTRMQNGVLHVSVPAANPFQRFPPCYAVHYFPEASDPVTLAQKHLAMVEQRGYLEDKPKPKPLLTAEAYLHDEEEERASVARHLLGRARRLGGLGIFFL